MKTNFLKRTLSGTCSGDVVGRTWLWSWVKPEGVFYFGEGVMIGKSDIERKDFSLSLLGVAARVGVCETALSERESAFDEDAAWGIGEILMEVKEDLHTIHAALYPAK